MPVVDGVCISVSSHSDSKVQKTVKSAQVQYIDNIACVVGSEIDPEVSITHDGMLASSSRRRVGSKDQSSGVHENRD